MQATQSRHDGQSQHEATCLGSYYMFGERVLSGSDLGHHHCELSPRYHGPCKTTQSARNEEADWEKRF